MLKHNLILPDKTSCIPPEMGSLTEHKSKRINLKDYRQKIKIKKPFHARYQLPFWNVEKSNVITLRKSVNKSKPTFIKAVFVAPALFQYSFWIKASAK